MILTSCELSAKEVTFDSTGASEGEAIVINYLRDSASPVISRSSISGFSVVACASDMKSVLRVCLNSAAEHPNQPVFNFGVYPSSYAFIIGSILIDRDSLIYLASSKDSIFYYLLSLGYDVTFVLDKEVSLLSDKREKLYIADALVIGQSISVDNEKLEDAIKLFNEFDSMVISSDLMHLNMGASLAVLGKRESILNAFTRLLLFYQKTKILRSVSGVCGATILQNPDIKNNRVEVETIERNLFEACGEGV